MPPAKDSVRVLAKRWKIRLLSTIGVTSASLLAAIAPLAATGSSAASSAPPWEPDGNAATPYGNVVFYNGTGNEVTSGTGDLASPFAYVAGATAADSGATKATVTFYNPGSNGSSLPANWTGTAEGSTTTFTPPPTGTPADLVAFATGSPAYPVAPTTADITTWLSANTPNPAPYANIIQVRLTDSGPFGAGNAPGTYWESDIGYNTTSSPITVDGTTVPADGWAQLFPFVTSTTTTLTSTLTSPQPSGTDIPLKATVSSDVAGSVQFYDGSTALGTPVTVSGGIATTTDNRPPASGSHSYTAVFVPGPPPGDETGAGTTSATIVGGSTSNTLPFTITAPASPTTTTVTSNANPSVFGQSVTYTAAVTVTSGGAPVSAGTVSFLDGSTTICSDVAVNSTTGKATCSNTPATVGSHTITANYTGNATFANSSGTLSGGQTVDADGTTTSLMSSANPGGQNQTVTFTAVVAANPPGSGTPGGTVEFQSNGADITTPNDCSAVTLSGGMATCSTTFSTANTYTITAIYQPDTSGDFTTSTGTLSGGEVIYPATTTAVSSSANPSVFGQSVTYTATVSPKPTGGTIEFKDGSQAITSPNDCSAVAVSTTTGEAQCTTTPATTGSHTITAIYSPGSAHFGSSTGTLSGGQQVNAAGTTTTVTGPGTTPVTGQSVTFTAMIGVTGPGAGNPAGTVTFKNGTTTLCSGAQVSTSTEKATCTVAGGFLAADSPYSITGSYTSSNGDFSNSDNTASPLSQPIDKAATTTGVTPSANPGFTNHAVTYTATLSVTAPGKGTPTGTVAFKDNGTPISCTNAGGQTVSGGKATCTVTYSAAGSHPITAVYSGDPNFVTSTASGFTENIEAVTVPGAPTGLTATAGPGKVTLRWMRPGSDGNSAILHYNVYDSTTPGGEGHPLVASTTGTQYTVSGLKAGTKYYFTVTAVNAIGNSAPSNEASATPTRILGYWMVGADGGVFSFGLPFHGSLGAVHLKAPIIGMAATPDGTGYWLAGSDGGVFTFGAARYHGSLGAVHLKAPIVGIASSPDGGGYWLVARDGGVFAFGDARFEGSLGNMHLNAPIVAMAAGPNDSGYWLVGTDGGVFTFGSARYHGSLGNAHLKSPIVGIGAVPGGGGYWLVGGDGGVFTFGTARYHGSLGNVHLKSPIVSLVVTQDGGGYWLIGGDGGVFTFGDAIYQGSVPGLGVSTHDIVGGAS